ncbi:MAG: DNA/RNA non-specific endonuclease [bacterium]|nr:DNA/RNA non-specific endonuclease [bacterium]
MKKKKINIIELLIVLAIFCYLGYNEIVDNSISIPNKVVSYTLDNIPEYSNESYVILNNNIPEFEDLSKSSVSFEVYSELDSLGRCTGAYASLSVDLMPTEERGSIGSVKPSGWHTIKYDIVEGKYLYNRCHLIGFQLAGENANKNNLITCTRYMNTGTMLEYENKVADYIRKTNNHVLYRVTPIYKGNNLLANGVQMEALSIEDNGEGIKFNIFVYNVQPGIEINYKNGESHLISN